jgi:hypothetical protein
MPRNDAMHWPVCTASMNHLVLPRCLRLGGAVAMLLSYAPAENRASIPAVMSPPGRANTRLAMVLVPEAATS